MTETVIQIKLSEIEKNQALKICEKLGISLSSYIKKILQEKIKVNNFEESPQLSQEESLRLFEKFKGSMKVPDDFDPKKEYLEYLDEKYGL